MLDMEHRLLAGATETLSSSSDVSLSLVRNAESTQELHSTSNMHFLGSLPQGGS